VPVRVRRALNVESGLNDGLATPIVLASLAALVEAEGDAGVGGLPALISVGAVPLAVGVALGLTVGALGAAALDASLRRHASSGRGRQVAVLALPVLVLGLAEPLGANAFVAAFVGGVVFGRLATCLEAEQDTSEVLETAADLLSFVIWFVAGALVVDLLTEGLEWRWILLAVLALTVLRLGPVAFALLGMGFQRPTVLFLGWFGPRGLATIVFALLAVEELAAGDPVRRQVVGVAAATVLVSVVAHGASAGIGAVRYGAWVHRTHAPIEAEPSVEPRRGRGIHGARPR
jgi:NhaP-type Na+/H+ or K+/H+ antiporter